MPESLRLRRLTIADYDPMIALWLLAGLPFKPRGRDGIGPTTKLLNRPDAAAFGITHGAAIVACGIATYDGRRGWINRVAVHPDYRSRGLAGQIINACVSFLKEQGATVIGCQIEEENTPSMRAFEKAGFVCWPDIRYFSIRDSSEA